MDGKWGAVLAGMIALALMLPAGAGAATIKVTTKLDELDSSPDATCSLREAVEAANTNSGVGGCPKGKGADTITLGKGTYPLTITSTDEDQNANGDLDVDGQKVTFRGKSASRTKIRNSLVDRTVDIHDATSTSFIDLQVNGGDVTSFGTGAGRGGAIAASSGGTITLTRTTVDDGRAFVGGGLYLAAVGTDPGKLKVSRSLFISNRATGLGGGLDVIGDATSTISKSLFYENAVQNPTSSSDGGGLSNRGINMTIKDTTFESNAAMGTPNHGASAGAIHNSGTDAELVVRRSLFEQNSATAPTAGFFEGAGAIFIAAGDETATITNSTFHSNTVGTPDGYGEAIYLNAGTAIVANTTFNEHGAFGMLHTAGGYLLVRNSILEGSNPCSGGFIDSGNYNLASLDDPECDFLAEDVTDAATFGFKTDEPVDNGGSTLTLALKKSSPAIDRIPKAFCEIAQGQDQRGFKRPARKCDIGAYERGAKPPNR